MPPYGPVADSAALYIQVSGALLFGMVFLFLYSQSRVVYFGLWAIAWFLRILAAFFGFELLRTGHSAWLAPYATFEFAFVIVLISAARVGFGSSMRDWRTVLRLIAILPMFVALVWACRLIWGIQAYHTSQAAVLAFVYIYNFMTLPKGKGMGLRAFRFSLLLLAIAFLEQTALFMSLHGEGTGWMRYMQHETFADFALHCVLAFSAMAMWSESQIGRIHDVAAELDNLRRDVSQIRDLDGLTGLLNQASLERRVEQPERVSRRGGGLRHGQFQGRQRPPRPPRGRRDPAQHRQPSAIFHPPRRRGLPLGRRRVRHPVPQSAGGCRRETHGGNRSPPARVPRARLWSAAHQLQLGDRRCPRPSSA